MNEKSHTEYQTLLALVAKKCNEFEITFDHIANIFIISHKYILIHNQEIRISIIVWCIQKI